jgi:hypothetical protein
MFRSLLAAGAFAIGTFALVPSVSAGTETGLGRSSPFLSQLRTVTNVASTVPDNGDLNP